MKLMKYSENLILIRKYKISQVHVKDSVVIDSHAIVTGIVGLHQKVAVAVMSMMYVKRLLKTIWIPSSQKTIYS